MDNQWNDSNNQLENSSEQQPQQMQQTPYCAPSKAPWALSYDEEKKKTGQIQQQIFARRKAFVISGIILLVLGLASLITGIVLVSRPEPMLALATPLIIAGIVVMTVGAYLAGRVIFRGRL
ncbi:MAG: hypothetical protein FWC82_00290 [Firmicutes bacterium]|nr:hypothetical protein [Bacillota bacterium]